MPSHEEWLKDGGTSTVPVTTATPAIDTPVVEIPAVAADITTSAAAADSTATPEAVAAAAAAAGSTPAEVAQAVQEFIEGKLGDQPFQIPKGVQIPWKRGTEQGFISIEDAQRGVMMEKDYRIKTTQLAEQRRAFEIEQRVSAARGAASEAWNESERSRVAKAYENPEEQARHEAFLAQYRSDPHFKAMVDKAHTADIMTAERGAVQEYEQHEALQYEANAVAEAIVSIGKNYPNVDADQIRQQYAMALQADQLPLSAAAIEHLYKLETEKATRYAAPLRSELDALRAELTQVRTAQAAGAHNATTRTSISRATNPVAAPAGGSPPAPIAQARTLTGATQADRSREWSRLRD